MVKKGSPSKKRTINFRHEALQHIWQRYSQYTLNGMLPSYAWGYLLFLALTVSSLLLWGIFGSVSEYVRGEGLLISGESSIYSISTPTGAHHLKEMRVKQGDTIKAGQAIAYFKSPELSLEIAILKEKDDYFKKTLFDYQKTYEQELQERLSLLNEQKQILNRIVQSEKQNIEQIQSMLNATNSLNFKGLVRNIDKRHLEQQFVDAQRALENGYNQLISNTVAFNTFKDSWQERIRNLEIKAKETAISLKDQEGKLNLAQEVNSHVAGKVIYIHKNAGDSVKDGESIATIAAVEGEIKAIVYLSGLEGKKARPGMKALISPTIIKKEEYGSIEGEVERISDFPESPQEILSVLKNETLVKNLTAKDPPIKAIINLKKVGDKFKWSSSKGPEFSISEGTYITATILVKDRSPISLIIPAFNKFVGIL